MNKQSKYRRIVVKIGSNVLSKGDGTLDLDRISALVDQIADIRGAGAEVIVVSSGAVAAGRGAVSTSHRLDTVSARQLYSAVGQVKLINHYYELFLARGIVCGQVLTTKESLSTRGHYLNQKNCMETMLSEGVVPILNENDTISVTELMFTDNDELAGLVSTMMGADLLVILTNVDGIFSGDPADSSSELIREVSASEASDRLDGCIVTGRSSFGRGGMLTKCRIARKVAAEGIEAVVANGQRDRILADIMLGADVPCTRFVAADKPATAVKKWIAHSEGFAKGILHVNAGTVEVLEGPQARSLLPVGVERVEGSFEKDDIVLIVAPDGRRIGVGRVSTDSATASRQAGRHGFRPLVHYDYLCLD